MPASILFQPFSPSYRCRSLLVSCGTVDERGSSKARNLDSCCNGSLETTEVAELQNCFNLNPAVSFADRKKNFGKVSRWALGGFTFP